MSERERILEAALVKIAQLASGVIQQAAKAEEPEDYNTKLYKEQAAQATLWNIANPDKSWTREFLVKMAQTGLNAKAAYPTPAPSPMDAWPSAKERQDWYARWREGHRGNEGWSSYNAVEAYDAFLRARLAKERGEGGT